MTVDGSPATNYGGYTILSNLQANHTVNAAFSPAVAPTPTVTTYTPTNVLTGEFLQYDNCTNATRTSWFFHPLANKNLNHCVTTGTYSPSQTVVIASSMSWDSCPAGYNSNSYFTDPKGSGRNIYLCVKVGTVAPGATLLTKAYLNYDTCSAGDSLSAYFLDSTGRRVSHCVKQEVVVAQ